MVLTLFVSSQRVEEQVNLRKEELEELFAEAPSLGAEAGDTDMSIEKRFLDLLEPLGRRKKQLELSKAKLQISRDLEDETVRDLQPTQGLRCQLPRGGSWLLPRATVAADDWSSRPLSHRFRDCVK